MRVERRGSRHRRQVTRAAVSCLCAGVLAAGPVFAESFRNVPMPDGEKLKYSWETRDADWEKQYLGMVKRGMQPRHMVISIHHKTIDGAPYYEIASEQLQINGHTTTAQSLVKRGAKLHGVKSVMVEKTGRGTLAEEREIHYKEYFKGYPDATVPAFMVWVYMRTLDFEGRESKKIHLWMDRNMTIPLDITVKDIDKKVKTPAGTFRAYRTEMLPDLRTFLPTAPTIIVTVIERFLKPFEFWFDADDPSHKLVRVEGKPMPGAPLMILELKEIINPGRLGADSPS